LAPFQVNFIPILSNPDGRILEAVPSKMGGTMSKRIMKRIIKRFLKQMSKIASSAAPDA
jgi:hypothetical protein